MYFFGLTYPIEKLGPIPETIRSPWKSDRITNFSSAHDFLTTIDNFISNITIVKIYKLPGKFTGTWSVLYQQFVHLQWR